MVIEKKEIECCRGYRGRSSGIYILDPILPGFHDLLFLIYPMHQSTNRLGDGGLDHDDHVHTGHSIADP
jgi:hypothetical protein